MYTKIYKKQLNPSKILKHKWPRFKPDTHQDEILSKVEIDINQKAKRKVIQLSKNQLSLSHSLNINDSIICNQQQDSFSLKEDQPHVPRLNPNASITFNTTLTPYQLKKEEQKSKSKDKSPKKFYYYHIQTGKDFQTGKDRSNIKSNHIEAEQTRIHSFFKTQKSSQPTPSSSLILKSAADKSSQEVAENKQNSTSIKTIKDQIVKIMNIEQELIPIHNLSKEMINLSECDHCQQKRQNVNSFFKNEQIKKNIQIIQNLKEKQSRLINSKHFPEFQVLNSSYFSENQKHLIKRVKSTSAFNSFNKMQLFNSKRRPLTGSCFKCKSCQKEGESDKQKPLFKSSNFQYFIYEYKSYGKNLVCKSVMNPNKAQPNLYLKKRSKTQNINSNHQRDSNSHCFNNTFDKFINSKRIEVPQRPFTAVFKQESTAIMHQKPQQRRNTKLKHFSQDNFVKPWDSTVEFDHLI